MAMPKFIALKSKLNDKYLEYTKEDGEMHGFLQFSGDQVVSPYTKYHVERAKTGNGRLVHIRCCYNNKYWVKSPTIKPLCIAAGADEPEEDQSKASCTLFEPIFVNGNDNCTVRLRHVQLKLYARNVWKKVHIFNGLCLGPPSTRDDADEPDVFTIIDWESLVILPKHITLKGDNGLYLSARRIEGHPYLQFASNDIADPTVQNEVFITKDGKVQIKNNHFGKFWVRSPNWIWADIPDFNLDNNYPDALFQPIKVGYNVVALRNLGNNYFCKRLTTEGKTSCLNAGVSTMTNEARLEVHEPVISREIYDVHFRLNDARIYNQSIIAMATANAANSSEETNTIEVRLQYKNFETSTWNSNVSWKLGVNVKMEAGFAFISEGKVSTSVAAEVSGGYSWGETKERSSEMETVYKVNVPPMTTIKVRLLATKGACDVPFSYSQRDTLMNGNQPIYEMDDGIYTGVNCFNFHYETVKEKMRNIGSREKAASSSSEDDEKLSSDRKLSWLTSAWNFFFKRRRNY